MWPSSDDTSSTTVWLTNTVLWLTALKMSVKIQGENLTVHITCYTSHADPSDRAVWGVGLRPFACWDCGFESRRGHGCLCLLRVLCFVRYESPRRANHPSIWVLPWALCLSAIVKPRQWGGPRPTTNFTTPFSFFDSHISSTSGIIFESDIRNSWIIIIIIISTTGEDFLTAEWQLLKKYSALCT